MVVSNEDIRRFSEASDAAGSDTTEFPPISEGLPFHPSRGMNEKQDDLDTNGKAGKGPKS
jgi:hypothetical protein